VWGHIGANKLRSGVTVLAVALGVAIALSVDLANTTAVASFASSVNVISNHINLQVLGVGRGFDERTILRVQNVPGVLYANPAIEDSLTVGARAGDAFERDTFNAGRRCDRHGRTGSVGAGERARGVHQRARGGEIPLAAGLDHLGARGRPQRRFARCGDLAAQRRRCRLERRVRRHRDGAGNLR
jgi:hypothetical protein